MSIKIKKNRLCYEHHTFDTYLYRENRCSYFILVNTYYTKYKQNERVKEAVRNCCSSFNLDIFNVIPKTDSVLFNDYHIFIYVLTGEFDPHPRESEESNPDHLRKLLES